MCSTQDIVGRLLENAGRFSEYFANGTHIVNEFDYNYSIITDKFVMVEICQANYYNEMIDMVIVFLHFICLIKALHILV